MQSLRDIDPAAFSQYMQTKYPAHTPGPWTVVCDNTIDDEPAAFTVNAGSGTVALVNTVNQRGSADARLLAALEELIPLSREYFPKEKKQIIASACAAIARAQGGA